MCEERPKECFTIAGTKSERCNNSGVSEPAEYWPSSRTFVRDLYLHISFALHRKSELVTFPKTLKRNPGLKKLEGKELDKGTKYDLTLCFSWQFFWTSLNPCHSFSPVKSREKLSNEPLWTSIAFLHHICINTLSNKAKKETCKLL